MDEGFGVGTPALLGCFQRGKSWGSRTCEGVTVPLLLPYPELFCREQPQPWHLLSDFRRIPLHPRKPQMKLKELLFHKHLIKRCQFLTRSFPCLPAHSSVWPLRPESYILLCSGDVCQQSSWEPEEAEAAQRVLPSQGHCSRGCHCGVTLQPAAQGRARAGTHSSGWICKGRRTRRAHGSSGSVLVLRSQRWRGCSQVGLRGSQEGQEGRTPQPSPSLEIAWIFPRTFLGGVVDQPCALCTYV